jgi:hypothetical protein
LLPRTKGGLWSCLQEGLDLLFTTNGQMRQAYGLWSSLKYTQQLEVDIIEAKWFHLKLFQMFSLQWFVMFRWHLFYLCPLFMFTWSLSCTEDESWYLGLLLFYWALSKYVIMKRLRN